MLSRSEFKDLVTTAYQEIYDLVRLRTHPLTKVLVTDATLSRKERAWRLHHLLLEAIEELDPGPQAPAYSHEWCRYRLMRLRYVNGLDPPAVARKIAVSRRQYYREHEAAIQAIGEILGQHRQEEQAVGEPPEDVPGNTPLERLELLRLEAGRLVLADRRAHLGDVAQGVVSLLQDVLRQHQLETRLDLPCALPSVSIDRGLLRQMLVGTVGYLGEHAEQAEIRLSAQAYPSQVYLSIAVEPPTAVRPTTPAETQERASALEDLAALSGSEIVSVQTEGWIVGFELHLPAGPQPAVLVVDDNEDVLELFQRYLAPHNYRSLRARTAEEALALARELQPQAITLDLMMPEQDGWDILQRVLNQPDTRHIPIIVCSVLKEKDLALSLGATAFLEKPVTEQTLLSALEALGVRR